MSAPAKQEQFRREIRLGLVLYGGVSLAVYINGVAREFFDAVKGRGPYRLLKAFTDSDIVVDVVSGTSAGGINGVFLSYALSNNRDFKFGSSLWRERADLQTMLRPIDTDHPASVLDSDGYFQRELEGIYRRMPPYEAGAHRRWESPVDALDLFVTGTDFAGEVRTSFDSLGHAIEVKDHRKVFRLKYRRAVDGAGSDQDRYSDFRTAWVAGEGRTAATDEARVRALATLSRITSTFPGAFAPVPVTPRPPEGPGAPPTAPDCDALLRLWGQFDGQTTFLDGGVLDNKPFSYTIKNIYYRTSEREVHRKLFYVEPDPERFEQGAAPPRADFFNVVIAALVGIPGYESIAEDLRNIEERNERIARYDEIVELLRKQLPPVRANRATPTEAEIEEAAKEPQAVIYRQSRVAALRDAFLASLLSSPGARSQDQRVNMLVKSLATSLVKQFRELPHGPQDAFLSHYDVGFAIRRLFAVTYFLYDCLYREPGDAGASRVQADRERYLTLLYALNRQIQALKVVQWAVEQFQVSMAVLDSEEDRDRLAALVTAPGLDPARLDHTAWQFWLEVQEHLDTLLTSGARPGVAPGASLDGWRARAIAAMPGSDQSWASWLPDERLDELRRGLAARHAALVPRLKRLGGSLATLLANPLASRHPVTSPTFVEEVEALTVETFRRIVHGDETDPVYQAYLGFEQIDRFVFPLEYLADLREKDRIELVRVSPLDAQLGLSARQASEKISGDALHHFGGFFKQSWRGNDVLWGRLDTMDLLFESLLTHERVAKLVPSREERTRIKGFLSATGDAAGWDAAALVNDLFDRSPQGVRDELARWFDDLLGDADDPREEALSALGTSRRITRGGKLDLLVTAAQRQVIEEDVPGVIRDAIDQSVKWGVIKRGGSGQPVDWERVDVDALAGAVVRETAGRMVEAGLQGAAAANPGPVQRLKRALAAKMPGRGESPSAAPRIADLAGFFKSSYKVGEEGISSDIPPVVLVRTVSHALIVLKNVMLGALEQRDAANEGGAVARSVRAKIRGARRMLKWGVEYPLFIVNALATLLQRQPGFGTALQYTVSFACLLLLFVGVYWHKEIWLREEEGLHWGWAVFFVGAPVVVLWLQWIYLRWKLATRVKWQRTLRAAASLAVMVAAVLFVSGVAQGLYDPLVKVVRNGLSGAWTLANSHDGIRFLWVPLGLVVLAWLLRVRR